MFFRSTRQLAVDGDSAHLAPRACDAVRAFLAKASTGTDGRSSGQQQSPSRAIEPRMVRVVECRFFGGLSDGETAEALGITRQAVQRDWVKARVLLRRALSV